MLEVNDTYAVNGHSASLVLSNVDIGLVDAAEVLASSVAAVKDSQVGVSLTPTGRVFEATTGTVSSGNPQSIELILHRQAVDVTKADLTPESYTAAEYINGFLVFEPPAKKLIRETLDRMG